MTELYLPGSVISYEPKVSKSTSRKSLLPKKNNITHIIKTNPEFLILLYQVIPDHYDKWVKIPSLKNINYE